MRTRITHIWMTPGVVAGDKKIPFIQDAEILIDGNRIVYAGKRDEAPAFEAEQVVDGKGALAMPGLCNLHTHTPMTLFRSIGADLPLDRWLQEAIWPLEKFLTDDAVRAGTDLGTLEMLRYGTTSFNDMYFRMDRMAESVQESGCGPCWVTVWWILMKAALICCRESLSRKSGTAQPMTASMSIWRPTAKEPLLAR